MLATLEEEAAASLFFDDDNNAVTLYKKIHPDASAQGQGWNDEIRKTVETLSNTLRSLMLGLSAKIFKNAEQKEKAKLSSSALAEFVIKESATTATEDLATALDETEIIPEKSMNNVISKIARGILKKSVEKERQEKRKKSLGKGKGHPLQPTEDGPKRRKHSNEQRQTQKHRSSSQEGPPEGESTVHYPTQTNAARQESTALNPNETTPTTPTTSILKTVRHQPTDQPFASSLRTTYRDTSTDPVREGAERFQRWMDQGRNQPLHQRTALTTTHQGTYEEYGRNGERFQNWIGRGRGRGRGRDQGRGRGRGRVGYQPGRNAGRGRSA